ncbi:MAG: hypothetical protein ABW352_04220 [Polyangiales bacterium]
MSEEQFREQLVDYLYDELDQAQRAAFEAELASSTERRAELEAMRATLRSARTGLSALDEEPPARLRGAILDAERASHVVRPRAWYRRGITVAPLLAAAAALTFAVLAPRPEHQPGPDYASEPAPGAPLAPAVPEPMPEASRDEPGVGELARAPVESKSKLEASDKAREKKGELRARSASRRGPALQERADDRAVSNEGFAQPPADWGSGSLGAAGGGGLRDQREAEERSDVPASRPAPAPAARAAAPKKSAAAESAELAKPARDAGSAPDELVQRAQEHMAAHRWSQAVIAYRELLQRFPKDERAARWRSELGEAARALSAVPLVP